MAGTRLSNITKLTTDTADLVFNRAAKAPTKKYYEQIVTERTEPKRIGNYVTIGDLGQAQIKGEGDVIVYDKIQDNYSTAITSQTIVKGVEASMESLEYDMENVVKNRFGSPLVTRLINYKERAVADAYNDGFTSTGADGVAIFSATHPLQSSVLVNDNLATGALTPENLIAAKNKFTFIYDQAGEYFNSDPTHLVIHKNKLYTALQIMQSQLMAFELSNTKNVVNDTVPLSIVVNPYLDYTVSTGVSPWFLIDKTMQDAGCILQTKKGVMLDTWWEKNNQVFRGTATEMYGVGFVSPGYSVVGSTGA